MARKIINFGRYPNDRAGTGVRKVNQDINANFEELYGGIDLETFVTELTFSEDRDLETLEGGSTSFTLATGDVHINGVGIVARINLPVAVLFGDGFEMASGSDAVSEIHMNIIIFRYFENYDGQGNGKVLYRILNQAAV